MAAKLLYEEISSIASLADGIYRMDIKSRYVADNSKPGQFVNIRCCEGNELLLRRPISICSVDKEKGTFIIAFMVKGKGTRYLSQRKPGDFLDIIGPSGNSFDISGEYHKVLAVGGGIGVFPLLYLLDTINDPYKCSLVGFRSKDDLVLLDEFEFCSNKVGVCTNDGSAGEKAFVTEMLEKELINNKWDIIYACGPFEMLKKVHLLAVNYNVRCQVSLEQRMGCGIGACLVCACKIKSMGNNGWTYKHVCKDGPIFWSTDVVWE